MKLRGINLWWVLLIVIGVAIVITLSTQRPSGTGMSVNAFVRLLEQGQVRSVVLQPNGNVTTVRGERDNGTSFTVTTLSSDPSVSPERLGERGVQVQIEPVSNFNWTGLIFPLVSVGLIIMLLVYMTRSNRGGGDAGANTFGKSRAHVLSEGSIKLTFQDVAGCDEAKNDLA
ncbi:ATP-dependent Zn protease, partial [Deinobacterium chartae]